MIKISGAGENWRLAGHSLSFVRASSGDGPDPEPVPASLIHTQRSSEILLDGFTNVWGEGADDQVKIGDLILYFGFIHNSATIPTLPSNFQNIGTSSGNTSAGLLAYRIATSDDIEAEWTPAGGTTRAFIAVIRGHNLANPIGAFSGWTTSSDSTPDWNAIDVGENPDGLMLAFRGQRSSGTPNAYPGMQIINAFGGQNSSVQAAVSAAGVAFEGSTGTRAGPYTTIPTGSLSAYQEPDYGSAMLIHTALLYISPASN